MTIDFDSLNVFQKFSPYIPWYSTKTKTYSVIIRPIIPAGTDPDPESLKNEAVDTLIEFYLPEFYPFLYDKGTRGKGYATTYQQVRELINENFEYVKSDTPPDADAPLDGGHRRAGGGAPPPLKYLFSNVVPGNISFKKLRLDLMASDPDVKTDKKRLKEILDAIPKTQDCPVDETDEIEYASGLPSYSLAQNFFNGQQEIQGGGKTVRISLEDVFETTTSLNVTLNAYEEQLKRFPSPLRIPLDLASIRVEAKKYMNMLVIYVKRDLNLSGWGAIPFGADDVLILELDNSDRIRSATYEVDAGRTLVTESLKIGLFSLVKHAPSFSDRWLMSTIAKHRQIISDSRKHSPRGPGLPSFIKFVEKTYGGLIERRRAVAPGGGVVDFAGPAPPGINPVSFGKIFAAADAASPIDITNPAAFMGRISTSMNANEAGLINSALNDPSVLVKLYEEGANKEYPTKLPLDKVLDKVIELIQGVQAVGAGSEEVQKLKAEVERLEEQLDNARNIGGIPDTVEHLEGEVEDAKAKLEKAQGVSGRGSGDVGRVREVGEIVNQLLTMFGIKELINEALICLTMGSNFSLERIDQAVDFGFDIAEFIEDYKQPSFPKPMIEFPEFPEIKIAFNITGDPPLSEQIKAIIIQVLIDLAFDIIKGLAEMIKHNCNNLLNRPEQQGALDAADAMRNNLRGPGGALTPLQTPDMRDSLNEAFGTHGLDQERGFNYLSDVSQYLSPFEICKLYNSPSDVSEDTIQKISIFNKHYSDPDIRVMLSRSQILAFFGSVSPLCDIRSICNEYINDVDLRAAAENYCLNEADLGSLADQESIKTLVDYLNNGIPIEIPPIDFLCPENENFIPNPIIERMVPQLFNTTIDNVKMQFIYALEATRATLLEPQVSVSPNPSIDAALKETGVLPEDRPKLNPAFIRSVANMFNQLRDPDFEINPDVCADLNMDKLGVTIEQFLDAIPILSAILQDALAASSGDLDTLDERLSRIEDEAGSDQGTASVTYIFPRNFYNNFRAHGRQGAPEYVDIAGSAKPNDVWLVKTESPGGQTTFHSKMIKDATTDQYGRLQMTYRFLRAAPELENLRILFYSNNDITEGNRPPVRLRTPENLLPGVGVKWLTANVPDESSTPLYGSSNGAAATRPATTPVPDTYLASMGTESDFNPYIFNFTYPLQQQLIELSPAPLSNKDKRYLQNKLQKQVFPAAFNGIIENTFNYIVQNGIFNMVKMNKLNLFKDNTDCDPSQQGDLLDARGILDQTKNNFKKASCNDEGTPNDLVTDALKYALVNLLIQVYLIEFIIKNIFVMSAFKFDEILNKPLFNDLLITSLVSEIENKLISSTTGVQEFIYKYFGQLMSRGDVVKAGGVTHSFAPNEVVSYLPTPGEFDPESVEFNKLLRYFVEERMGYTHLVCDEPVNTMQSINNILAPIGASKPFEDAFITDILGIYAEPYGRTGAPMKSVNGRVFFAKYVYWDGISNWGDLASSNVLVPWQPDAELAAVASAWDSDQATWIAAAASYRTADQYIEQFGDKPTDTTVRHTLPVRNLFGSPDGGAMPISTTTAIDFVDVINLTDGKLPAFENLKVGYKLMFNFPAYQGADYSDNDWDQSDSPFVNSFKPGKVRNVIKKALDLQRRATFRESILDSAMSDLDTANAGPQILGDLLTVEISSLGDFDPNRLATDEGESEGQLNRIKKFNERPNNMYLPKIKENKEYVRFINQTFNPEIAMMIPALYNLGLTSTFFPGIQEDFQTTKETILGFFGMMQRTNQAPEIIPADGGPASQLANSLGSNFDSDMDNPGREFILKALAETPLKILKGVVELVDPHVAISKIIKDITGMIFLAITKAIDTGLDAAKASVPDVGPMKVLFDNISGEDLLALAFCGINSIQEEARSSLPDPPGPLEAPNLGPRLTLNGLDFTGTIAGLFMMPPSPLGIIYILIKILEDMKEEDDAGGIETEGIGNAQTNVADTEDSNVC